MKKIILSLVALFSMSANSFADGLTATLQQGDQMTPFYGVDAFKQAYAKADSGAVITLSAGNFNTISSVAKSVTIIGNYAFTESAQTTFLSTLSVSANNVTVEGIRFSGDVTIGAVSNLHIKRCYLNTNLKCTANHTNTLIDECVVMNDYAVEKGYNYCIKNSTLQSFRAKNTTANIAYIANCVVWDWYKSQPYAIYKNNVLCNSETNTIKADVNSEFYYNLFVNTAGTSQTYTVSFPNGCVNEGNIINKNYTTYFTSKNFYPATMAFITIVRGQDGKRVGINGGTGFSEWPAIPRITSKTIDSSTDAEGKINVKIAVKVQQ